jgi:epoxyqueuosine reductase QueG
MTSTELKQFTLSRGIPLTGIGDLHEIAAPYRNNLPLAVVLAAPLDREMLQRVFDTDYPLFDLALEYQRVNEILRQAFEATTRFIQAAGYRAIAMDDHFIAYDRPSLAAQLTHKICATRAGLGWIGKSGLLVTKEFGPAVRLTTLLTDAPLQPDQPVNESACGPCTVCTKACPVEAIKGNLWQLNVPRQELLDPHACQAYKLRVAANTGWTNPRCGRCVAVCPRTRRYVKNDQIP